MLCFSFGVYHCLSSRKRIEETEIYKVKLVVDTIQALQRYVGLSIPLLKQKTLGGFLSGWLRRYQCMTE
jgi:hypothetical protein